MIALVVIMLVLAWNGSQPVTEFLDFTFYDATDKEYRSTRVMEDMTLYQAVPSDPMVLLIETSSLEHPAYVRQSEILQTLTHQERSFLCVVACPNGEDQTAYHTNRDTARSLVENESHFRVVLLDSNGSVIKTWKNPVSARQLRKKLPKATAAVLYAERDVPITP